MTIGERREELNTLSIRELRRMFRRVRREQPSHTDWVDCRKRADLVQGIINYEVGLGGRME